VIKPEISLTNNSVGTIGSKLDVAIGAKRFSVRYGDRRLFVAGRSNQAQREMLRHTSSLISLNRNVIISVLNPPSLTLNYAWDEPHGYSSGQLFPTEELGTIWQRILDSLAGISDEELTRRYNEISFVVAGFDQTMLLEDRLTNLYKALESFDGTRTLSSERISRMFDIGKGDAKFVCEMRNNLMHRGMSIEQAALNARNRFASNQNISLEIFRRISAHSTMPRRIYFTLSRLITAAFFREFGIGYLLQIFPGYSGY